MMQALMIISTLLMVAVGAAPVDSSMPTACEGSRRYELTIDFKWSSATHPNSYPDGGLFSPVVAAAHDQFYSMFVRNDYASRGVERMAETGEPEVLVKELNRLMARDVNSMEVHAWPTSDGVETVKIKIMLRDIRYRVSFMSQLYESPDWFTGISSISMCDEVNGKWIRSKHGQLSVFDAGSDEGEQFGSEPQPIYRLQPIKEITDSKFEGVTVGSWRIDLV